MTEDEMVGRQQRGPRASPGTGRGDGAHREPLVKVGSAPGAWQGLGTQSPEGERSEVGGQGSTALQPALQP